MVFSFHIYLCVMFVCVCICVCVCLPCLYVYPSRCESDFFVLCSLCAIRFNLYPVRRVFRPMYHLYTTNIYTIYMYVMCLYSTYACACDWHDIYVCVWFFGFGIPFHVNIFALSLSLCVCPHLCFFFWYLLNSQNGLLHACKYYTVQYTLYIIYICVRFSKREGETAKIKRRRRRNEYDNERDRE